jgi:radical SAM protein with 4Fe4S-binding SPASM domain
LLIGKKVLNPQRGQILQVNEVGRFILSLCNGQHSVERITEFVSKRYGIPVEVSRKDVKRFLDLAYKEGIISWGENEMQQSKGEEVKKGRAIYWEITRRCNLNCKHCYASEPLEGKELGVDEIERILEEGKDLGVDSVTLTGGEPFVRDDVWQIIELILEHGVRLSIITNATLIDKESAKRLAKLPVGLQVSMDGARKEIYEAIRGTGSFDLFMKGLRNLLEEGLASRITLSCTITKPTAVSLRDFFSFARRIEIKNLHFSWLIYQGNARKNWARLSLTTKEQIKVALYLHRLARLNSDLNVSGDYCKNYLSNFTNPYFPRKGELPCPLGHNPYIDAAGFVYGCQLLSHPDYRLGNCREESLTKILDPLAILRLYQSITLRPWNIEQCEKCRFLPFCRGGCPAEAISVFHNPLAPSPTCEVAKGMFRYFIRCLLADRDFVSI